MELHTKFTEEHANEKLTKQEGNFSPLTYGTGFIGLFSDKYKKYYSTDFKSAIVAFGEKSGISFFNFKKYQMSTKEILEKFINGDLEIFEELNKLSEEIRELYKNNPPEKLANMSQDKIKETIIFLFNKLYDAQTLTLFCEALDEEIIKGYIEDEIKFNQFIENLNIVSFETFIHRLNKEILDYIESKNNYSVQWLLCDYIRAPFLEEVESKLLDSILKNKSLTRIKEEIIEFEGQLMKNKNSVSAYFNSLNDLKLKALFNFSKESIYIRDSRKELFFKLITLLTNAVRELLSRHNIEKQDIIYSTYSDFKTGLYKIDLYSKILQKRKNGFLVYFNHAGQQMSYADYISSKNLLQILIFPELDNSITGKIASKGRVIGTAKIIFDEKDFYKINQGDILVSSMTRPEFVPIMNKASAIVTDEGGITCHAAIISREMRKPCIVGTENATRAITDGDLIEVDAEINGIIRIIQKNLENSFIS
ncbi:MAG: PEP-utilizing enzyme [archaeon]